MAQTDARPEMERGIAVNDSAPLSEGGNRPLSWCDPRRWSYQAGMGFITKSSVDEIITGPTLAQGKAAGEIYLAQVSYKVAEFDPTICGHQVRFDVELPLVLGIVNEHGSDIFPQYSAGLTVRWKTFPWNRWLYTNVETGAGVTYSAQVLGTEHERHPGRNRSHTEFYWPIQIILAHPEHREHQLVIFNHHHSGGGVFHKGGANTVGLAYRYVFAER